MKSYFLKLVPIALIFMSFLGHTQSHSVKVDWESDGDSHVVEVKGPDSKVSTFKVKESSFDIPINSVGKYRWRVKSIKWGASSAFSDWGVIIIKDAIVSFDKVLMTSPKDNSILDLNTMPTEVTFEFNRPVPGWNYSIEILEDDKQVVNSKVAKTRYIHSVSETSKEIKWRVRGTNEKGDSTKNSDYWNLNVISPKLEKTVGSFFYDFYVSQFSISQKFSDNTLGSASSTESFIMQGHGLGYRYLAKRKTFHSAELAAYYSLPIQFSDEISIVTVEAKARFNVFGGAGRIITEFDYSHLTYKIFKEFEAVQNFTFLSVGYESTLNFISPKMTGALLLRESFIPLDSPPGARARLTYHYSPKVDFNLVGDYSQNKPKFKVGDSSGTSETVQTQVRVGFTYTF